MPLPPSSPAMTDHTTDTAPTIYTATTPAELRTAVIKLCLAAIEAYCWYAPEHANPDVAVGTVVPPVPQTWRIVTISGQSYRCADGALEYLHFDGTTHQWSKATWVHPSHILLFADLLANPTEPSA